MVSDVNLHPYSGGGGGVALDAVSFAVHAGEQLALVGPSGGGKSTALKVALRLLRPATGAVLLCGGDAQPALIGRQGLTRIHHNTLLYQYRLCYTMPLYCTGSLSRSVT